MAGCVCTSEDQFVLQRGAHGGVWVGSCCDSSPCWITICIWRETDGGPTAAIPCWELDSRMEAPQETPGSIPDAPTGALIPQGSPWVAVS